MPRHTHLTTTALTMAGLFVPARAIAAPETPIDVVVVYAIDSDTDHLVRYAFATDSFMVVGELKTASGTVLHDCETLGYIPQGPAKGMYTVPTVNPFERKLVKINPLTGVAEVFAPPVVLPGRKVTGMTHNYDPIAREWYLLAASSENRTSGINQIETRELIRINPLTGTSTIVATQAQLGNGYRFEGLGIDSNGDIWATSRARFHRIDYDPGNVLDPWNVVQIGVTGLEKAEAFEIAFGDWQQPSITVPGVDPSWTSSGVFFVADEQLQKFGVLNPADGSFAEYLVGGNPSQFVTKDAEGIIVLTYSHDPLYGSRVSFD